MNLLFVKHSLSWPRSSGHDVHTYYMMRACGELGHEVSLATALEPTPEAIDGLRLANRFVTHPSTDFDGHIPATRLQRRFRSYYGISDGQLDAVRRAAAHARPDAVIVVGLDVLPYFPALSGPVRVWYAADEWVLHHLSLLRLGDAEFMTHLRDAVVKGLYERAHRQVIDRVWVVSDAERRAMRWFAGMPRADVLANGVDADYFSPGDESPEPYSAIFWGRLDFGPNVQGLQWFFAQVWPLILTSVPRARFTIVGFKPIEAVKRLAALPGVSLISDLPDLRATVRRHQLVVLPMISGGGIKNKLLEAAAMAKPIVCTPAAAHGLNAPHEAPLVLASSPRQFSQKTIDLWSDAPRQKALGMAGRAWVLEHHTWMITAQKALESIAAHRSAEGAYR
jgi:glycosyltransferase involved in cell wall biosynthesis